MGNTVTVPTIDDLTGDPQRALLAATGLLRPPPQLAGDLNSRTTPVLTREEPQAPDFGLAGRTAPSVIPSALPMSRFALTKPQTPTTAPGINPPPPPAPNYFQTAANVASGEPGSAQPMTKLGKLLFILKGVGTGAAVGSTQPTFGTGFEKAQEFANQQTDERLKQQQQQQAINLTRAQAEMVDTPFGKMPAAFAKAMYPAQIAAQAKRDVAETQVEGRKDVTQMQTLSREKIADIMAQAKRDAVAGQPLTADDIKKYNLPPQFLGTRAKITDLAAAERAGVFKNSPVMTDKGLVIVNRENATARQATGPDEQTYAQAAMAMPKEVADPNNPGQTVLVPAGQSMGMAGTQSAALQVPRAAAKAAVPKNIGDHVLAFNTALRHADLLEQAVRELNNPDSQTISGLINRVKTEFGATGPTSAQVIADAYNRELTKMLSGSHLTDAEISTVGRTLDPQRQNLEQVLDVLAKYRALSASKLSVLNQTVEDAVNKAQVKKTTPGNTPKHPVGLVPF